MPENIQKMGKMAAFWCGLLGVAASVASTWLVLPTRLDAVEKRQAALEQNANSDRILLVRIEERLKQVQEEIKTKR